MKYAFYPGCVSKGGAPELYTSTMAIADKLGIELEEIVGASCTGAGVLQEKGLKLGDTLNARTFAMAERMGLTTILNISHVNPNKLTYNWVLKIRLFPLNSPWKKVN